MEEKLKVGQEVFIFNRYGEKYIKKVAKIGRTYFYTEESSVYRSLKLPVNRKIKTHDGLFFLYYFSVEEREQEILEYKNNKNGYFSFF